MPPSGKWIDGLTAATPLPDAARRVLDVRLAVVGRHLEPALRVPHEDPEHVHQLRVGTRRAGAALQIFGACLPDKVARRARRRLRRLRRAAGEARDWDVFLLDLTGRRRGRGDRPGRDFLAGYATGQRAAAQARLDEVGRERLPGWDEFVAETVAAVGPPADPALRTLRDLARPLLFGLLRDLEAAAGRSLDDYDHLHQVRIAGKRLRYGMEVFVDCFPPPFRELLYPAVEEMQEILGHANDRHVAGQRLAALRDHVRAAAPGQWNRVRGEVESQLRSHRQRLARERRRFLRWLEEWRRTGAEAAFAAFVEVGKDEPAVSAAR